MDPYWGEIQNIIFVTDLILPTVHKKEKLLLLHQVLLQSFIQMEELIA